MRENFTAEEWSALIQAPMQAVMGICLADRVDPVSFLQEVKSGIAIVAEEAQRTDVGGDLAPALLAGIAELDAADPLAGEQLMLKKQFELLGLIQTFKTSKEGRDYAIAHLQKVAALLDTKVTGLQAAEFKQWLLSVATKVAEAHREGGIMGIGSSRISDKENDMLRKMDEALGL
ncbi:hypothetical protein [Leptolyngbya sp. KIOST-1]|uniref:hypothetical protein n=1 Tax=Leptolyngbya sp. KIOST-1 TaxID=1229172 RepID=UPI000566A6C4|nr:hypothetical protein [Leptolyngbya sp. KIOST-1]